jgi:hypothetical protein
LTGASADGLAPDTLAAVAEWVVEGIFLEAPAFSRADRPCDQCFDALEDAVMIGLLKKSWVSC